MRQIHSAQFDFFWILSVGFWATLLAYGLDSFFDVQQFSALYWLVLVVGIDVSHVYSTLFRTYLSSSGFKEYKKLLILIPCICFLVSFSIAYQSVTAFWRVLVYVAVFHFIRQQAGFVRIYNKGRFSLDELMVYVFTSGAVLLWHLNPNKIFHWFIKDDFYQLNFLSAAQKESVNYLTEKLLLVALISYVVYRVSKSIINRSLEGYQKFTLVISTFVSWYFGIVISESDFIFTMTNILTHGVPYLALVWFTQKKEKTNFSEMYIFAFILLIVAFFEEGFWDALIWREHNEIFSSFYFLDNVSTKLSIAAALSILILPQLTHYILDGFIWKSKGIKRSWLN